MAIDTIEELRGFIAEEMHKLADGLATPASVNAMANLAGKMIQSAKLEVDYNRIVGATPDIGFLKKSKKLKVLSDGNKENM